MSFNFISGVANRGCSIRIPRQVAEERKGNKKRAKFRQKPYFQC